MAGDPVAGAISFGDFLAVCGFCFWVREKERWTCPIENTFVELSPLV
jgi:hypothetical protein